MRILAFLFFLCASMPAWAQLKEFEHIYDIDLDEDIPLVWRLQKEYEKENSAYDWRYDFTWRIPSGFNYDFKRKIKYFGAIEKRIENADEEGLLRDLHRMPKEFYPYVGPMLHTVRGLSGKILDLPGIKETKNKFPNKIASRLQNIPDLQFLSPELYIYLMPQLWGEDMDTLEFPHQQNNQPENIPNVRINPEFIRLVKKQVPISRYWLGAKPQMEELKLRNYVADVDTPLTNSDVKAFIATLDDLFKFRLQKDYEIRNIMIAPLINYWDQKQGVENTVSFLKTVVNPCQSLVRKIKWTGLQSEFQKVIGKQSFGLDDWAYTCDKTLKAFRVVSIPNAYATTLKLLRRGYIYRELQKYNFTPEETKQQKYFLEATLQLYKTTQNDLKAVKPYQKQLFEKLLPFKHHFMGTPIVMP